MSDSIDNVLSTIFVGNGLTICIACFIVGTILKGSITKLPNRFIPFINIIIAEILGFVIPNTFEGKDIGSKIILLAFLGLSSVGLYESISIILKNRFSIDLKKLFSNKTDETNNSEDVSETLNCEEDVEDTEKVSDEDSSNDSDEQL